MTCPLFGAGCGFIHPEGRGGSGVMVVGEAAGANEARDGLPFRPDGASGSLLERVWSRIGMARDQFFISNALHCQPPGNALEGEDYETEALEHCQHFLDAEIKRIKPRAILALGGVAMRTLSGLSGPKRGISALRGFVLEAPRYDIPLIGSYHPAFLRRGQMSLMGVLIRDFQLALSVARQGAPAPPRRSYNEYPTLGEAEAFCARVLADPRLLLAYDIETNYSHGEDEDEVSAAANQITQVQFSIGAGTGIAFPWAGDYIEIIRRILGASNTKLGFNVWHFDNPILRSNGIEVGGVVEDLMWAWHHLQPDLPRNLQFVTSMYAPEFGPWKHLAGVNLADYGCRDVDVLQRIWPSLERDLKARGIWRGYEQHVRGLWPILEGMSRRGMPLSAEKQAEFRLHLETALAKIDGELQLIYPEHLKDLHPKAGFVRTPEDTSGLVQIVVPDVTRKEKQLCNCVTPEGLIASWTKKAALRGECCKGVGYVKAEITGPVSRWAELVPFKPSPPQLIRYMHFKGHKVPKVIGGNRETTSKLFIERMARDYKDPLYKGLLEYRSIQKFKGTYLWSIGPDGRVHPTFKYTPATGQLAATDPPVLTIPSSKAGPLAAKFRETIAARSGYTLLECDYKGFHTSTFAFEAKDQAYMRLANVIEDTHSFLTAVLLGQNTPEKMLAMGDDELRAYLGVIKKKYKDIRDGQAKPAILGYALGMGANKLYEMNRFNPLTGAGFKSKYEAEKLIQTLRKTFPKGYQYQQEVRAQAHRQGYLINRFGFIRWFWDVMSPASAYGEAGLGEQAESAIAFNVQCDAHGHLKENLLELQHLGMLERYGVINVVHDSIVFEVETKLLEEAAYTVCAQMAKPSKVLVDPVMAPGGLAIGVEAKYGPNLGEMKVWEGGVAG